MTAKEKKILTYVALAIAAWWAYKQFGAQLGLSARPSPLLNKMNVIGTTPKN